MKYSTIGKDIKISKLCFGCEPLSGFDWGDVNISSIEEAIEYAVDIGVNFFDTADIYGLGLSEKRLSNILGNKRYDMQVATKGGVSWIKNKNDKRAIIKMDSTPQYLEKAIDKSLQRLKLDIIPIYYIHWPDKNTNIKKTFEFLQKEKEKGKIGLIACSNYNTIQIEEACSVADVSLLQLPLNILNKTVSSEIFQLCDKYKIKIVAYNVLANGLLSGKYNYDSTFQNNDRRSRLKDFQGKKFKKNLQKVDILQKEAKKYNLTLAQYSIKFVNEYANVCSAITGIKNLKQLKENIEGVL